MTAEQIRRIAARVHQDSQAPQTWALSEIAAQLAEVNEHLKRIAYPPMTVITQNRITEAHIPKEE